VTPAQGEFVALLARKGRFLVAEPFFPESDGADARGARRRARQVVVGAARGRGAVSASAGDLVLLRAPGSGRSAPGRAQVVRVIGRPEEPRDVIEALMLARGLRRGFEPALAHEAAAAAVRARSEDARGGRTDLRSLPTFTVDPASARDFDDALSAQPLDQRRVRVWVHIADVSACVPEGSLIDEEAWRRGTSVYVPGAVEPMLPEALSNDVCSLVPGEERLALTVELDFDRERVVRAAFHRSLIRSDARLEYDQVDRIFAGAESAEAPWEEGLQAARAAAAVLEAARRRSGALELDSFEPEFVFDESGAVRVAMAGWGGQVGEGLSELRDERGAAAAKAQTLPAQAASPGASPSRRMIEHLMIAANEAVARHLSEKAVPCLFRVHERPEPQRVEYLVEQLASLGVPTPPVPERVSASQAAELVADISVRLRRHFEQADARSRGYSPGWNGRMALTGLLLRTLQQAYYSPRNIGHAGLGSAAYCHFTSPIRRYPDLVCHRALLSTLGAGESAPSAAGLGALGAWTSEREREALSIEREAADVARCFALERELFEEGFETSFPGEVTGVISGGAFVAFGGEPARGVLPPFEGMVPVRRLRDRDAQEREWWELNEQGTALHASSTGRTLRLADPLAVRVARIAPARGRVELGPAIDDARPGAASRLRPAGARRR
jgi:ribonuclease R